MKKIISLFLVVVCCFSVLLFPASAVDTDANVSVVSTVRTELPDGGYIIETIKEVPTLARTTHTKAGVKEVIRYTGSGTAVYGVEVTGQFNYDGSSARATYSAATVYTYVSSASYVSKYASYSGNSASATGSVKYLGITETRTATLYCDKNGNLS